jgi:type II secretory pathway component HofQ
MAEHAPNEQDPRRPLKGLDREARGEFEDSETRDTGGQEHATPAEQSGAAARPSEAMRAQEAQIARATRDQSDADLLRVPREHARTGPEGESE